MLIPNQKIKVKWHNSNIAHYKSLGYEYTKYGDSFFVSPEDLPSHSKEKVGFICDFCNKDFYVTLKNYNRWGHSVFGEYKCLDCYTKNIAVFSQEARTDYIYDKILDICNKYGYNLKTPKNEILNINTIIEYECPIHGSQFRRAHLFVYGEHICPQCNTENKKLAPSEVSEYIRGRGSYLFNPEDYQGTRIQNLKILCVSCGEPFVTSYNSFYCTNGDVQICPNCWKNKSKGERKIIDYLDARGIDFIPQKTFDNCRDERGLPFDFYIPKYNLVIEYDGKQHFEPISFCSEIPSDAFFAYTKKHDAMKNIYCFINKINLIRIPYYDYDLIEEKLNHYFNSHEDIV